MRPIAAAVLVAGAALAGCSASDAASVDPEQPVTSSSPVTFLASRTATGGMCVDGTCESVLTVSSDGSWTLTSGDGTQTGALAPATTAALVAATSTTGIPDAPTFTGTCPTAYDGSELVYSWRDAAGVTQTVSACDRAIEDTDPLVVALATAADEADSTDPGDLTDQAARTGAIAQTVVGMPEADAIALLEGVSSVRITTRVVARDGETFAVTEDYSPQRVNLTIEDGIVTSVSVG